MPEDYRATLKDNTYQSRRTRSVTFRLDSAVIDELQTEAKNREISLNVLVNQVLKRYEEWDRYENKIGMMPVPKMILSSLIDKAISIAKSSGIKDVDHYRDEVIKQAAELAFSLMKDSVTVHEETVQPMGGTIRSRGIYESLRDQG